MTKTKSIAVVFQFSAVLLIALASLIQLPAQPLAAQGDSANLIPDPGFETDVDPWQACGDASGVDLEAEGVTAAMVHTGRYAARIHYDTDNTSCGGSAFFDPVAQLWQEFTVPADAQDLTISFWYSRIGETYFPLQPILGTSSDYSERDVSLAWVETLELEGWNFYRTELNLQELERVRGKSISLFFSIFTTPGQQASVATDIPSTVAPGSYYIDDVRVTTSVERTTAAPLPAALQGDGTRPLVFLNADGVARLNSDGSAPQLIYEGEISNTPVNPVWSSSGNKIAVLEGSLVPANNTNPNVNPAFITVLSAINADGSGLREIFRTNGTPGTRSTPVDDEVPALDVEIRSMDWSPDDDALAVTICSQNRGVSGSTSDPRCWIEIIDAATGGSRLTVNSAFRASWSSDNRILFEDTDSYQDRADGIWEIDMSKNPPVENLIVPGTGEQFDPSYRTDNWPVWSPDSTQFVTVRDVAGFHYNPDGSSFFHDAIMLFDRATGVGKTLLLVDHGTGAANFTWSPDGKYLLYSLFNGNAPDVWWVEVATGTTGKVTTNGASIAPDWRPTCVGETCDGPTTTELNLPLIRAPQK